MKVSVVGLPATQGSKRGFPVKRKNGKIGVAIAESNPEKHRAWKALVIDAAMRVTTGPPEHRYYMVTETSYPVVATFTFYLPKPRSCPKHRLFPDKKPDLLKLARLVEDALTLIAYRDDAQIVDHHIRKRFAVGRPPGVEIELREATEDDL